MNKDNDNSYTSYHDSFCELLGRFVPSQVDLLLGCPVGLPAARPAPRLLGCLVTCLLGSVLPIEGLTRHRYFAYCLRQWAPSPNRVYAVNALP